MNSRATDIPRIRIEPHVMRVAIVVILGSIMSVLDTAIVNVALHQLSRDLHAGARHDPLDHHRLPAVNGRSDATHRVGGPPLQRPAR
ncbi:MAG: hypothetical protein ACRDL5_02760 [Solirubrobacteraceae bacterium]